METPLWNFNETSDGVYEPREDTFLLLDAIEADLMLIKEICKPTIALEMGSGSGILISAVAKALNSSALCLAIDINPAACKITAETAYLNTVTVEVLTCDLLSALKLKGQIDLFLFNPPYVPSEDEEVTVALDKAWAGSVKGRCLINRLFKDIQYLLSERCVGYLVAIEENDPEEIIETLEAMGFSCATVAKRKVVGERLSIIRFSREITTDSA